MLEWPLVVDRKQVDGVVLVLGDELAPHPPFPAPIPAVFIFDGPPHADVVTAANFDGGRLLGAHLAELGHRRVAYLGSRSNMSLERLAGLRMALGLNNGSVPPELTAIPPRVGGRELTVEMTEDLLAAMRPGSVGHAATEPSPHSQRGGVGHAATEPGPVSRRGGVGHAATEPGPEAGPGKVGFTALACYNDYMAAAAIMHLRQHGIRVPEDVSVVGFDNVRPPWYDGPALTTVNMPLEEIGAEVARILYWRLAHPDAPPRRLVLSGAFVEGATTRRVDGSAL